MKGPESRVNHRLAGASAVVALVAGALTHCAGATACLWLLTASAVVLLLTIVAVSLGSAFAHSSTTRLAAARTLKLLLRPDRQACRGCPGATPATRDRRALPRDR
jgi:hypothetical protein